MALFLFDDAAGDEIARMANQQTDLDWMAKEVSALGGGEVERKYYRPPSKAQLARAVTHGEPILTGDPLADEWERAIARGEMPDLDMKMPGR